MAAVSTRPRDFVLFPHDPLAAASILVPGYLSGNYAQGIEQSKLFNDMASGMPYHEGDFHQEAMSYDQHGSLTPSTLNPTNFFSRPAPAFDSRKQHASDNVLRLTPSASPSSFSQSYDQPPSIMSSASGASGQSTTSSAGGSPHLPPSQHLSSQDKWSETLHRLGMGPDIVNTDSSGHESYPLYSFERDLSLEEPQYQNFVGELELTTSSIRGASPSQAVASPFSSSQNHCSSSTSSSLALHSVFPSKNITIDSILDEINQKPLRAASEVPPLSVHTSHVLVSDDDSQHSTVSELMSPNSTLATSSSVLSSLSPFHKHTPASPLSNGAYAKHVSHLREGLSLSQEPSFNHSSGRFIAPLEASCSLS